MWVLILMLITSPKDFVVYDQGIYETMDECMRMKKAMLDETFGDVQNYKLSCVRIPELKQEEENG